MKKEALEILMELLRYAKDNPSAALDRLDAIVSAAEVVITYSGYFSEK